MSSSRARVSSDMMGVRTRSATPVFGNSVEVTFSEFEFDLNQIDLNQMIKNRFKISVHFEMII